MLGLKVFLKLTLGHKNSAITHYSNTLKHAKKFLNCSLGAPDYQTSPPAEQDYFFVPLLERCKLRVQFLNPEYSFFYHYSGMHDTVHAFTDNEHDRLPANIRQIKTTLHTRGQNTDLGYSRHFLRPHTGSAGETEPSYTPMLHTPLQQYMHPSHAPGMEQHIIVGYFLNVTAFVFTFCPGLNKKMVGK